MYDCRELSSVVNPRFSAYRPCREIPAGREQSDSCETIPWYCRASRHTAEAKGFHRDRSDPSFPRQVQ